MHRFLLFGRFPDPERWRPALVIVIFAAMMLVSARAHLRGKTLFTMWGGGVAVSVALMFGGFLGMPYVETELWNGVPLNLLLTVGGCGCLDNAAASGERIASTALNFATLPSMVRRDCGAGME